MSQAKGSSEWVKAARVAVGDLVADKYRVDGILGRGGMGVVVSATDVELDRKVAIKFVERNDEQATARFLREARAAANLDSQHITRVYECGRLEQGSPFIVMERLHGDSFATLIDLRGRALLRDDYAEKLTKAGFKPVAQGRPPKWVELVACKEPIKSANCACPRIAPGREPEPAPDRR